MPRLTYLERTSHTFRHPEILVDYLKSIATDICNATLDDVGWIHSLVIRLGGVGLRRASFIALPAYLASISAGRFLISEIALPDSFSHTLTCCIYAWSSPNPSLSEDPNLLRQWVDIQSSSRSATFRPLIELF